jgi:hypothetical protein
MSFVEHKRSALHQRMVQERDTFLRSVNQTASLLRETHETIVLDHSESSFDDELVGDGIHSPKEPMPTHNGDNPLLSLDPKGYSLFEDVERSLHEEDPPIDWDEYIFEAVNQLADEEIPAAHIISKRRQSSSTQWYPFKSKEVRHWARVP